ncbi:MAG TPA: flagellin [Paraburkholderia sp.]|uniref:flagellin N-terminal helical domain-containing protein n=1 Tax=Paraburkholderia sp. TaxID=1926495 RepID=UPI002DE88E7D|nr:flagellin [Paraburkholderia sp.]
MLGINSNINSLVAQQNLTGSGSALSQAITRLSSGKRINSAADDAAGLAISNIMQTQINGLNQGVSNSNDGTSMVQTASSGLSSLTSSLQRIRQLATQASNGGMTDTDRAALQQEVSQQVSEINRIASQTTYNGMNVLNGSLGNVSFQVGANVGQTISLSLTQNMSAAQLGGGQAQAGNTLGSFTGVSFDANGTAVNNTLTETLTAPVTVGVVTAVSGSASASIPAGNTASSIIVAGSSKVTVTDDGLGNAATSITATDDKGDTFSYNKSTKVWALATSGGSATPGALDTTADAGTIAGLNSALGLAEGKTTQANAGVSVASMTATIGSNGVMTYTDADAGANNGMVITDTNAIAQFNNKASTNGDTIPSTSPAITSINVISDGKGNYTLTDQNNMALSATAAKKIFQDGTVSTDANGNTTLSGLTGTQIASDINTAQAGTAAQAAANNTVGSTITTLNTVENVSQIDISTAAGASAAMESIDNALNTVNQLQATLGAAQNRFTAIGTTQQAQSTDLSTAQSNIQDADFAQETANLSKAQVLQQAGISVLAQANSQPQQILKLLQ